MKKVWFVLALSALILVVFSGCTLLGGEDPAIKVLKDYVEMVKNADSTNTIYQNLEDYIYIDPSLQEKESLEDTKEWLADMIWGHREFFCATATINSVIRYDDNPSDVPEILRNKVEKIAVLKITFEGTTTTDVATTVEINGHWYVEAVYNDDNWYAFYPWNWVPMIVCPNNN